MFEKVLDEWKLELCEGVPPAAHNSSTIDRHIDTEDTTHHTDVAPPVAYMVLDLLAHVDGSRSVPDGSLLSPVSENCIPNTPCGEMISAELSCQRTGDFQISGLAGGKSGRYRYEKASRMYR